MKKIDYQKILHHLLEEYPHELEKIEQVIRDAKENGQNIELPFSNIIKNSDWSAEEKEKLLKTFDMHRVDHVFSYNGHSIAYTDEHNSKHYATAIEYTLRFDNESGFTALVRTIRDAVYEPKLDKYDAYMETLRRIINFKKFFMRKYIDILFDVLTPEELKNLLKMRFNSTVYGGEVINLLVYLINVQKLELIKKCLPYVEDIDIYLPLAVKTGNKEIIACLLDAGADINYPGEPLLGIISPIKEAILENDFDMVKFLAERGASIDTVRERNGKLLEDYLSTLSDRDKKDFIEYKLKNASGIDFINNSTAMEFATILDDNFLTDVRPRYVLNFRGDIPNISHSIDFSYGDKIRDRLRIVDYLFTKSNDKDWKIRHITDLLCISLIKMPAGVFEKYINFAIENGCHIDFNYLFEVFVKLPTPKYSSEFIELLIKLIKHYDENLLSPLFKLYQKDNIVKSSDKFVVAVLNAMTEEQRRKECLVPHARDLSTLKYFLDMGFDINEIDEHGNNVMINLLTARGMYTVLNKDEEELFEFLIDRVDLSRRDKTGKTALYYALWKIDTSKEYMRDNRDEVRAYTKFEALVAKMILKMDSKDVTSAEIVGVLEERINCKASYGLTIKDGIYYEYIYNHHKDLFEALVFKGLRLSDAILTEIFDRLYGDEDRSRGLRNRIDFNGTEKFIYERLDRNLRVQKGSIENRYNSCVECLAKDVPFEKYLILLKGLVNLIESLETTYEKCVKKRFDPERYLEYVKHQYNVDYVDIRKYLTLFIIRGLMKYGRDKLDEILKSVPGYDINSIVLEENIGMSYWTYVDSLYICLGDGLVPDGEKMGAQAIATDCDENILFIGGLMQYAILIDDIDLVKDLLAHGAKLELVIDGEDRTWDYVNSKAMLAFMESNLGSKGFKDMNSDEKAYFLSVMNSDNTN